MSAGSMSVRGSSTDSSDNSGNNQQLSNSYSGKFDCSAAAHSGHGVEDSQASTTLAFYNDEEKEHCAVPSLLALSTSYIEAAASAAAAESREKKRKLRIKSGNEEWELKKQRERLAANRRSAALSRQRKKDLIKQLQLTVMDLTKKNVELQNRCDFLERQLSIHQTTMLQQAEAKAANMNNINIGSFSVGGHLNSSAAFPWNSSFSLTPRNIISTQGLPVVAPHWAALQATQLFHLNQQQNQLLQHNLHQYAELADTDNSTNHSHNRRTDNKKSSNHDQVSFVHQELSLKFHGRRRL